MTDRSLNLLSLNARGLSNFRKRRTIFTWCRKRNSDIIFLQETHSTLSFYLFFILLYSLYVVFIYILSVISYVNTQFSLRAAMYCLLNYLSIYLSIVNTVKMEKRMGCRTYLLPWELKLSRCCNLDQKRS